MPETRKDPSNGSLEIGTHTFKIVNGFIYLGSEVNCKNNNSDEIQRHIISANKSFHGLRKHLRKTKITLHKVLMRPVLTYAADVGVKAGR